MDDQCESSAIKNVGGAKPIEGSSIRLWPISLKDAHAIAAIMTPDLSRWLASWPANPTIEAVTERLIRSQNGTQQKRELHLRIEVSIDLDFRNCCFPHRIGSRLSYPPSRSKRSGSI